MDNRRTHNTVHAVATEYILDMYKIQNKVYINLQEKLILSVLFSNLWERIIMRKYKIKIPKHKKLSPVRTHYKVMLNAALNMKKKKNSCSL